MVKDEKFTAICPHCFKEFEYVEAENLEYTYVICPHCGEKVTHYNEKLSS